MSDLTCRFLIFVMAATAACAGRTGKDTIKIGVREYDEFFLATNALLYEHEQGLTDQGLIEEDTASLGARAQELHERAKILLTRVGDRIEPRARGRVRRAIEEAIRRIDRVRASHTAGSGLEQSAP